MERGAVGGVGKKSSISVGSSDSQILLHERGVFVREDGHVWSYVTPEQRTKEEAISTRSTRGEQQGNGRGVSPLIETPQALSTNEKSFILLSECLNWTFIADFAHNLNRQDWTEEKHNTLSASFKEAKDHQTHCRRERETKRGSVPSVAEAEMLRYLIKTLLQMNLFTDTIRDATNGTDLFFNISSIPSFNSSMLDWANFTGFNGEDARASSFS